MEARRHVYVLSNRSRKVAQVRERFVATMAAQCEYSNLSSSPSVLACNNARLVFAGYRDLFYECF